MKFIYDYLTASILGVAVFFLIATIQVRGIETSQEQTQYYASKTHLLEMKTMIEHDFENIGAGVAPADSALLVKTDSTFIFRALLDAEATEPSTIEYRRLYTRTITVDGEAVPLYEVHRLVDGSLTGKSPDMLKEFVVELRDDTRQPTADFDAVTTVYVRFVVAPPLGSTDALHEARWMRAFRPANLAID